MADTSKLGKVGLVGIGNLLEQLVAENALSCIERDAILGRIARDEGFSEIDLLMLTGYGQNKVNFMAQCVQRKPQDLSAANRTMDDSYVSLTDLVREHCESAPGYVIQSWMRSDNTLAFLNLWEKENNPGYREDAYIALLEKKKTASVTLTPKQWIEQTNAIGIVSKRGKSGGTLAHPTIACEFASWLSPEFKMLLLKLSLSRDKLK